MAEGSTFAGSTFVAGDAPAPALLVSIPRSGSCFLLYTLEVLTLAPTLPRFMLAAGLPQRESSLLTTYWSGSTDVFGGPSLRHGSLNFLFQVALYLPS